MTKEKALESIIIGNAIARKEDGFKKLYFIIDISGISLISPLIIMRHFKKRNPGITTVIGMLDLSTLELTINIELPEGQWQIQK